MAAGRSYPCEPRVVLRRPHRLLEPAEAVGREPAVHLERFVDAPRTVGVEHERGAGPDGVARGLDLAFRDLVELHVTVALGRRALGGPGDGARVAVAHEARVELDLRHIG